MKKIILVAIVAFSSSLIAQNSNDVVLMNIADKDVTLSEFENIYKKNNSTENGIEQKSLNEYVELFVNFKLKVKAAEELGLDTGKAFLNELAGYRKQLAQPYLIDKDLNDNMITQAYERLKTDIKASHILVRITPDAPAKDTLTAYNAIMKYRKRAEGKEGFEAVATEIKTKENKEKVIAEDLGYFTAFQMVYKFENAAYNTEAGKISSPVRTRFGYHILKIHDKRPARGQVRVAHIMVKDNEKSTPEQSAKAKEKVDEIYNKLKTGEEFEALARSHSDDNGSARKGGALPWFGTGRMVEEFESAAYSLVNKDDYCEPIKTPYGWHIIKLLEKKELGTFEELKTELKTKVARDGRASKSKQSLVTKLKKEYGYQYNEKLVSEFYSKIGDSYFEGKWNAVEAKELNKQMFSLTDNKYSKRAEVYTQLDFANYLQARMRKQQKVNSIAYVDNLYNRWVEDLVIKFEDQNLEAKYSQFKALIQEYRDGILLFDLMDKKVWSKAVKDTTGLKQYYESNKEKFMWEKRLEASIYSCANAEVVKNSMKFAKKSIKKDIEDQTILSDINKDSQLNLKIESGKFQKGDREEFANIKWEVGITEPQDKDGKLMFIVVKNVLAPEPKTLKESRGLVTAGYQSFLEEAWIKELREKYSVSVNQEVLKKLN